MNPVRRTACILLATGALLMTADVVHAATYYVSKSGSDGRSCSQAASASTPKASVNGGISCLRAGDTLYVRGGIYGETLPSPAMSGTSWDNKIRIASYPGESVWLRPPSADYVVYLASGQRYVEFDGINMDGAATLGIVKIEGDGNAHHIRIQNAELLGNPNGGRPMGIMATAFSWGVTGGNEFINLTLHRVGGGTDFSHGIYLQSSDNLVDNCDISDVPGGGVHIYNSIGDGPYNTTIRNSAIHDISNIGGSTRGWGIIAYGGSGTTIYNNVIYRIGPGDYGNAGVSVGNWASYTKVYNNTFYGSSAAGVYVASESTRTEVLNNIIYATGWGNLVNRAGDTWIANNVMSNPGFVNADGGDFRLTTGSAAIDRGMSLGFVPTDRAGTYRPVGAAYDTGAYEFGSGGSSSVPPPSSQPSAPTGGGSGSASPDGTRVPGAAQVVDNSGSVWTIASGQNILRNGGNTWGAGSVILWYQGRIYVFGTDSNWWQWNGFGWAEYGRNDPSGGASPPSSGVTAAPSEGASGSSSSGTRTPATIVDGNLAVWTIGSGQRILRNGSQTDGYGSEILWYQNRIYVLGTDSNWYYWVGSYWAWFGFNDPSR